MHNKLRRFRLNFMLYPSVPRSYKTVLLILLFFSSFLYADRSKNSDNNIEKIDRNFAPSKFGDIKPAYMNALKKPFVLEGFAWFDKEGLLNRIPKSVDRKDVNYGVISLAAHTSGGVVRFRTDSPFITLRARLNKTTPIFGHMPDTGSSGFDLFCETNIYLKTVNPRHNVHATPEVLEVLLYKKSKNSPRKMRDYSLYLPLYNGIKTLEIGVEADAKFESVRPHKIPKPVLFYGSSITQGACASRPSNSYVAMLARKLDFPMINFGFSGSAKGEKKMAQLIASLDLAAFVLDYDYNAPDIEHLKKTHEPFFKIVRKAHPDLPIVILGKIEAGKSARADVIRKTYENAVAAGDKKVWYVPSPELVKGVDMSYMLVDGCHPNDLGFYVMFKNVLPVLKKALESSADGNLGAQKKEAGN